MLRDVKTTVTDGGLGIRPDAGIGVHLKIGVSSVTANSPIIITGNMSAAKIKQLLGLSPLADAVMDSVESGAGKIYCVPIAASVDGTIGAVKKVGTGTGSATVEGKPGNAYEIIVQITESGGLNAAALKYSVDGGYSFGDEVTLPLNGELAIPDTGLTFKFTEDSSEPENSFKVGDMFTVKSEAPQMSNQDVLDALTKLRNSTLAFEFVHIVGESTRALWFAVAAEITTLHETYKKPIWAVLEAPRPEPSESIDAYAQRLIDERKGFKHTDVQIVSAWSRYTKMDGRTMQINNAAIVCGWYAKAAPQQSIGETKTFSVDEYKMSELLPVGIEDYIGLLDDEKYLTFRQYEGLEGYYVTNARMMCPDGSDYRYAENVRIKNKLIRETRKEALKQLQAQVDMSDVQGSLETIAKFIETPVDVMARTKEISSGRIEVPPDQDILVSETLQVIIRFVPVGYVREIVIDLGMENPFVGGA
ncbi:DUF2586 domain-containing protein [Paenibacillus sanguinis]|uniref:DUF2586 domain-containing protein n=1 Tax=Paenibacillus sanguinis TaxID=225906 RepID=UPI00036961DD|nr:DUF2586 domain-containing protein [Paenibacillus sanguinis]